MAEESKKSIESNLYSEQIKQSILDPSQVLHVLDAEINQILQKEKQPGWTSWAIYGAIATLTWLLFNQLENLTINITSVSILFLLFSLSIDFIELLLILFLPGTYGFGKRRRFFLSSYYANNRFNLILQLLRFIAVIFLVQKYSYMVNTFFSSSVSFLYGTLAFGSVLIIVLSFLRIPLPPTNICSFVLFSSLSSLIILSSIIAFSLSLMQNPPNISDYRVGSLLTALSYLILLLTRKGGDTPLLSSLVNLRRDLVFGKISVEYAVDQADIALRGLQISDVLQEDVRYMLELFNKVSSESEMIISKVNAIKLQLPENLSELSAEQRLLIKTTVESFKSHIDEEEELIKSIDKKLDKFIRKLSWLGVIKKPSKELFEILIKLKSAISSVKNKIREAEESMDSISKIKCDF